MSPEEDAHLSLREKFVTSEKRPEVKLVSLSVWCVKIHFEERRKIFSVFLTSLWANLKAHA